MECPRKIRLADSYLTFSGLRMTNKIRPFLNMFHFPSTQDMKVMFIEQFLFFFVVLFITCFILDALVPIPV